MGVSIAFDATALAASPTWTSIDAYVTSWEIQRGRTFELDQTSAGVATVNLIDRSGRFDPTNTGGTYYGKLNPNKQLTIVLQNPVDSTQGTLFRGLIEDYSVTIDATERFANVTITATDLMGLLAQTEVIPDGNYGTSVLASEVGMVKYAAQQVDDRIKAALLDAGITDGAWNIFSGNVADQDTLYSPRSSILSVIADAADSEFPGVGNFYISKQGTATFHGRLARFNPGYAPYGITTWHCGDVAAAGSGTTVAQISSFTFERAKSKIINAALATPNGIDDADIAGQVVTDTSSIGTYGVCSRSFENLITLQGDETTPLSALAETKQVATYYVQNYASPRNRVSEVEFKIKKSTTNAGKATWALMCGIELTDVLNVKTTHPGGGGFNEDFFVEGLHYRAQPFSALHPEVTLTCDLSPAAYYTTSPWGSKIFGARALATAVGRPGTVVHT